MLYETILLGSGAGAGFLSSKAGLALIEKCSEAMGGLLKPWQIVRMAKAEGQASIIKAEADEAIKELALRTQNRLIAQGMQEQQNIETTILKSLPNLQESATPEYIDQDWLAHFFDKTRLVSNEQMQDLWAQVLAGEANAPGCYSRRTIEFLSTMSQQEAMWFRQACSFIWKDLDTQQLYVIADLSQEEPLPTGITVENFKHLADIGLFTIAAFGANVTPYYLNKPSVRIENNDVRLEVKALVALPVGDAQMTNIGRELYTICRPEAAPDLLGYTRRYLSTKSAGNVICEL
ncbi:DUF2806 domain-containing protein [Hymenobacter chitinivorans]|nr:DUF2806 domain-containing protein [Hymenobacter chitinivorans]